MFNKVIITVLFLSVGIRCANADDVEADPSHYAFHPMSIMSLGLGFNPSDITRTKIRCIVADPVDLESGSISTVFSTQLVTNHEQLQSSLGMDSKIDASYLIFKGSATFNFHYSVSSSDDSATVVVSAVSEFGRKGLSPPKLTVEAKQIVGNSSLFANTCGTRFVNIEHRGASVSAIVTIRGLTKEEKTTLVTGVTGEGGWGPLSAAGSTQFQAELAKAVKTGRADIQVVSTGGNGFGGLGDTVKALAATPESLPAIQTALGIYISQFNSSNSVPIGFDVESMEALGWAPATDNLWTLQLERKLRALVQAYRETRDALGAVAAIKAKADVRASLMTADQIAAMDSATPAWESRLDEIAGAYQKCKTRADDGQFDCALIAAPANLTLLPPVPVPPRALFIVIADDARLDEISSRAIVYDNSAPLLDRVSIVRPGSHAARIVFSVVGEYLVSCNLQFRGDPSPKSLHALAITPNGSDFPIATDTGLAGMMADIFSFTTVSVPRGKGVFFLRIRDSLGRVFDLDIYEAEWSSNPPFSDMKANYTAY
jgi:hypothetical protein